jgi:ligand-binding sensor domain-containing protein
MEKYYKKIPAVSEADNFRRRKLFYLLIFLILLIFQSGNAQEQWRVFTTQNSILPSNMVVRIAVGHNNVKWIGVAGGMVRIDGNIWQVYDSTNTPLGSNNIYPYGIDIFNNLWVSIGYMGIAKFDGVSWTIYDTTNSGIPTNATADIKIDEQNVKWIATNRGLAKFNDTSWVIYDTLNSGIPSNGVVQITIDGYIKWVGTFDKGIGRFNDTTWTTYNIYNSGLPGNFVRDIKIDYTGNAWIATHFSGLARFNYYFNQWVIYNTTNSGIASNNLTDILTYQHRKWIGTQGSGLCFYNDTNWTVFTSSNSPLPGNYVFQLGLDSNKNLWICTDEGLAVYNANGIIGILNNKINLPLDFVLHQNYPNPFNPITNIVFEILKSTFVELNVYDIQGKLVTILINSYHAPGKYNVTFDVNNLPSGIYYYRLKTEKFTDTKKMVLIR